MRVDTLNVQVNAEIDNSKVKKVERLLKGIEKRIEKINNMKICINVDVSDADKKWWHIFKRLK